MSSKNPIIKPFSGSNSKKNSSSGKIVFKVLGTAIVLLALISLIFSSVFYGQNSNRSSFVFGSYGNKKIIYDSNNAFGRAVEHEMARYANASVTDENLMSFLRSAAWNRAFRQAAFLAAIEYFVEKSGYQPSSITVDKRIVDFGPFRTGGKFDEDKYRNTSSSRKQIVREQMREQILINSWAEDTRDGIVRSKAQLDFMEAMKSPNRIYNYISIPFSDYPDEKILEYGREKSNQFRRVPMSRITVSDEETGQEVLKKYEEKSKDIDSFGELAREYSSDSYKDEGGSMGPTSYHDLADILSDEEANQVFNNTEGGIAGPFKTDFGWILVRVDGAPDDADISERLDEVRQYMLQNELGLIEDFILAQANSLKEKAQGTDSFKQTMVREGLEVKTTDPFPINYGSLPLIGSGPGNDSVLSSASKSDDFWSNLVKLKKSGDISNPVILSNSAVVFSLVSQEDSKPLDYWESLVASSLGNTLEEEFQKVLLNDDSTLFKNNFSKTYSRIFSQNTQNN